MSCWTTSATRSLAQLAAVRDPEILEHLRDVVLHAYLEDTDRAMILDSAGSYRRPDAGPARLNAQQVLLQRYTAPSD